MLIFNASTVFKSTKHKLSDFFLVYYVSASTLFKANKHKLSDFFNPFIAPACKISGLNYAQTRLQTV